MFLLFTYPVSILVGTKFSHDSEKIGICRLIYDRLNKKKQKTIEPKGIIYILISFFQSTLKKFILMENYYWFLWVVAICWYNTKGQKVQWWIFLLNFNGIYCLYSNDLIDYASITLSIMSHDLYTEDVWNNSEF